MKKFIAPEEWTPVGVTSMEPKALAVVRAHANSLVVAGPGAGKTELLAQRACFLLQTGQCRPPRQILAISFKTDAAANLRERVRKRCGEELSRRFHSQTFAAFSKGLIDRFGQALPPTYRPTSDYEINFDIKKRMRAYLDDQVDVVSGFTRAELAGISEKLFYERVLVGQTLPLQAVGPKAMFNLVAEAIWRSLLTIGGKSQLDFDMIGRLAELLFRSNPLIKKALRQTYSHVFLDEFQDTTGIQYALTRELFHGSPAVLTAVGDSKQRIMTWAGAVANVFDLFKSDFAAIQHDLVMNYRSAPRLVHIQQSLIAAIEPGTPAPTPADDGSAGMGECRVLVYPNYNREASHLAEMAERWVIQENIHPRDICFLTRNRPQDYSIVLIEELAKKKIKARVETELQELLVEPLTLVIRDLVTLAVVKTHRDAWVSLISLIRELRGLDESDSTMPVIERDLVSSCGKIRATLAKPGCTLEDLQRETLAFFQYLGTDAFCRFHPEYLQKAYANRVFKEATAYLWKCREESPDWNEALKAFVGESTIPIITVHKSKGLEYHTVIFVGLEDSAMFNFANESEEEKRNFFVAFSRAKKRVIFTFCHARMVRNRSGQMLVSAQAKVSIGEIYQILAGAGVMEENVV